MERKLYESAYFVVLILILFISGCNNESRKPFSSYVVLVSLDGFRWDYPDIYDTPNLDKLGADGIKADRMIPSFPTKTFPNHYAIATGLYPDNNGSVENTFFAGDLNKMYRISDRSAVENPDFYSGEPIWITAMKNGMKAASFYWVGSEAPIMGMHPTYWKKYDEKVPFEARIDTVIKWLGYPEAKRPEFVTLYFEEPDATSHDFGPFSEQTEKVVEHLDSLIGVLRHKLAELQFARKINLIVVSDHGMGQLSPDKYINLRKIVPERMIKTMTGGNPLYMIEPNDNSRDTILSLLNSVTGLTAWSRNEIPAKLNYGTNNRIADVVVVADSSWSIGTYPDSSAFKGGAHGYDNSNSDMHAIFYAYGPAIKSNFRLKQLNNIDVYNLICKILELQPAKNDGSIANIEGVLE